ncbi:MAG: hypothetical protein IJ730_03125, partial [Alphaproteobacteria bacterium]|nr:hypothetical protein [Alphaproteobacteria bacterium]
MRKKITIVSLFTIMSMFLNYGILNAGSSASVTDEDKKASEEVATQQENKENSEKTEAVEKKEETSESQDSENDDEENKKTKIDEISESNEELYKQELTKASKSIMKKFENLRKDITENNKDGIDPIKYTRNKANELFLELSGDKEELSSVEDLTIQIEDSDVQ